jgi:hypothetical protein
MKTRLYASMALSAGLALGSAMLSDSAQAEESATRNASSGQATSASQQQRIADTTRQLESAFSDQFARGKVDRDALAKPISDVIDAMPESARPKVKEHIDKVLQEGEALVSKLTPEQRAQATAPPPAEKVGKTQEAIIAGFGWPGFAGFGGFGAFGFPGAWNLGWGVGWPGWGLGWGLGGIGLGFGAGFGLGFGGIGFAGCGGFGFGCGLGCGGWGF